MILKRELKKRIAAAAKFAAAFVMFALLAVSTSVTAEAATADITLTVDSKDVSVGDRVPLYININASEVPGNFEGYILYDSELFEYVSGPECVAGDEGMLKITDAPQTASDTYRKYVLLFKAIGRGEAEFTMSGSPELYEFEEGYLMSVAVSPVTVNIKAAFTASSDADLAELRCNPGELTPQFSKDVTEYMTTVGYDTEKLVISAHANNLNASVAVEGNSALSVGQNRITITVTAENGDQKKYVVYCVREDIEVTEAPVIPDTEPSDGYPGLKVIEGVTYIYGRYEYEVCSLPEGFSMPEGYVPTEVVMNGRAADAYVREDSPDSDFILMVLKDADGEPGLYCYDRVEKTIQRYESGSLKSAVVIGKDDVAEKLDREQIAAYEQKVSVLTLVVIVLCGISAVLMFLVVRMFLQRRGYREDD